MIRFAGDAGEMCRGLIRLSHDGSHADPQIMVIIMGELFFKKGVEGDTLFF